MIGSQQRKMYAKLVERAHVKIKWKFETHRKPRAISIRRYRKRRKHIYLGIKLPHHHDPAWRSKGRGVEKTY